VARVEGLADGVRVADGAPRARRLDPVGLQLSEERVIDRACAGGAGGAGEADGGEADGGGQAGAGTEAVKRRANILGLLVLM
jgi:hypothetical protein